MQHFIARDKDGTLKVFNFCPKLFEYVKGFPVFMAEGPIFKLDKKLFIDEITFENSPQKISFENIFMPCRK